MVGKPQPHLPARQRDVGVDEERALGQAHVVLCRVHLVRRPAAGGWPLAASLFQGLQEAVHRGLDPDRAPASHHPHRGLALARAVLLDEVTVGVEIRPVVGRGRGRGEQHRARGGHEPPRPA